MFNEKPVDLQFTQEQIVLLTLRWELPGSQNLIIFIAEWRGCTPAA